MTSLSVKEADLHPKWTTTPEAAEVTVTERVTSITYEWLHPTGLKGKPPLSSDCVGCSGTVWAWHSGQGSVAMLLFG